jgi:hypothetical protein
VENLYQKREELLEAWGERTRIAAHEYQRVKAAADLAYQLCTDAPPPDGNFAYRQALQAETAALAEYRRTLTIFTDLLLHGKTPDQEEG